jgi:MOSC domain-containing protein YiiM
MRIVSVNVAQPREVAWKGMLVSTGIFKKPVGRRLMLRRLNLDGDQQADLSVHGGPGKAVYAYPSEHYEFWGRELGRDLDWGMFGENFTLAGLLEDQVRVGGRYRIGSAEVMVTQPRVPCYKLALKFGRDDIIKRFLQSGRSGFYLSVLEEGEVGPGDALEKVGEAGDGTLTIAEVNWLYLHEKSNVELLKRAVRVSALPAGWRSYFAKGLASLKQTATPA